MEAFYFTIFYIACLTGFGPASGSGNVKVDLTLQAYSKGQAVVEATLDKIHQVFQDDKLFLLRMAYVETKYGTAAHTYGNRNGKPYYGGIWQIDETLFQKTKQRNSRNLNLEDFRKIKNRFGIDWLKVQWKDLLKPFYSGLAARFYLLFISAEIDRKTDIQAQLYSRIFGKGLTANDALVKFNQSVVEMENTEICNYVKVDIVFCLDASGTIDESEFWLIRNFVVNSIRRQPVSGDKVRIGVILFHNRAEEIVSLNTFNQKDDIIQAVRGIPYVYHRKTNTAAGINTMVNMFKKYGRKSEGVLSVGVVITDGESQDKVATFQAAQKSHAAGINVLAFGVGDNINYEELREISSSHRNLHRVLKFKVFKHMLYHFQRMICRSVSQVDNECTKVRRDIKGFTNSRSPAFYNVSIPNNGATVILRSELCQFIELSVSHYVVNPNSAIHDYMKTSNSISLYVKPPDRNSLFKYGMNTCSDIYMKVVGKAYKNITFSIAIIPGDVSFSHSKPNILRPSGQSETFKPVLKIYIICIVTFFLLN